MQTHNLLPRRPTLLLREDNNPPMLSEADKQSIRRTIDRLWLTRADRRRKHFSGARTETPDHL